MTFQDKNHESKIKILYKNVQKIKCPKNSHPAMLELKTYKVQMLTTTPPPQTKERFNG